MARAAFPPDLKFKTMRDQAVAIFHAFDHNNDGTVSEEELGTVMKQLDPTWTDDAVAALVKSVDTSQDGRLQFGEFFDWMFCEEIKRDDDSRRKLLGSSGEVAESVLVEVFDNGGDRVFGPEELPGSKTGVDLKELITLQTGVPAGTLCSGGRFLLGSASLGSCGTAELTLTMGRDVLTDLTEKCRNQLRGLGAMGYGDQCIRVGKGEHTRTSHSGPKSGSGDGDDDSEFMLTPDGRVLAKEYHYFGYKDHTGENVRAWRYQIAEGTFTIVDAETCKVHLDWQGWAERRGVDHEALDADPKPDVLKCWQARLVDAQRQPFHIVPSEAGVADILAVARSWLKEPKEDEHRTPKEDPLGGIVMPGITESVLLGVGMDPANAAFWRQGSSNAGPFH